LLRAAEVRAPQYIEQIDEELQARRGERGIGFRAELQAAEVERGEPQVDLPGP
jgi:hypothetical protein